MFGSLHHINEFLGKNVNEIEEDALLKKYGIFISLIHIYTFLFWFFNSKIYAYIGADSDPICQPFFQGCRWFRLFNSEVWRWLLVLYFFCGCVGVYLWIFRSVKTAYLYSIAMLFIHFIIYAQDYRLMGNYHYIFFVLSFVYFFIARKIQVIPVCIVLIYLGAGILKFNYEWLSGAALYGQLGILRFLPLEWATAYVVILEMGISFLLLSQNNKVRLWALLQFLVFHIYSIQIVGLYYPLIMFSFLSIFGMLIQNRKFPNYRQILSVRQPFFFLGMIFVILQVYPKIFFPRSAVTGEGRLLSLNMFDAQAVCNHVLNFRYSHQGGESLVEDMAGIGTRIKCDPYLYLEISRNICQKLKEKGDNASVDLYLESRKYSEEKFTAVVAEQDICSKNLNYRMLSRNPWIRE